MVYYAILLFAKIRKWSQIVYYPQSLTVGQQTPWSLGAAFNQLIQSAGRAPAGADPAVQAQWSFLRQVLIGGAGPDGTVTTAEWVRMRPEVLNRISGIERSLVENASTNQGVDRIGAIGNLMDLVARIDAEIAVTTAPQQPAPQQPAPQQPAPQLFQPGIQQISQQQARTPWLLIGGGLAAALVVGLVLFLVLRKK